MLVKNRIVSLGSNQQLNMAEEIVYKDVIHHTTTTKFPFWQRVRHLFGAPVVVKSEIKCQNEPGFILSTAKGIHTKIFPRKKKGKMYSPAERCYEKGLCPECGAKEVEASTPRTVYACGSSDYDQRPGSFVQSENCKAV